MELGTDGAPVHDTSNDLRKDLRETRRSLEKARSLAEMVRQRERKKRELTRVMRREFTVSLMSFAAALGLSDVRWKQDNQQPVDAVAWPVCPGWLSCF